MEAFLLDHEWILRLILIVPFYLVFFVPINAVDRLLGYRPLSRRAHVGAAVGIWAVHGMARYLVPALGFAGTVWQDKISYFTFVVAIPTSVVFLMSALFYRPIHAAYSQQHFTTPRDAGWMDRMWIRRANEMIGLHTWQARTYPFAVFWGSALIGTMMILYGDVIFAGYTPPV